MIDTLSLHVSTAVPTFLLLSQSNRSDADVLLPSPDLGLGILTKEVYTTIANWEPDVTLHEDSYQDWLFMASGSPHSKGTQLHPFDLKHFQLNMSWDDVLCPICLDFPHNAVLIYCTSYEKGCRPFMCDTGYTHSNCLNRFKHANGIPEAGNVPSTSDAEPDRSMSVAVHANVPPACPLCRGEVTGWVVINEARKHLNEKQRCCEGAQCKFVGNYLELQKHAEQSHPHARPSEIDPARQLDWENFQQSSELIDVLSTIHSEVPHGVVLGDYIIEYGEDDRSDDYEDFPGDDGNWWTSCILYQVFDNLRASRNRRRSRASQARSGRRHPRYDSSDFDDSSVASMDISEYRMDETDDESGIRGAGTRGSSGHRSSRRRHSRFYDH